MKGVGEPERERGFAGSNPAKYPDKVSGLLAEEVGQWRIPTEIPTECRDSRANPVIGPREAVIYWALMPAGL